MLALRVDVAAIERLLLWASLMMYGIPSGDYDYTLLQVDAPFFKQLRCSQFDIS